MTGPSVAGNSTFLRSLRRNRSLGGSCRGARRTSTGASIPLLRRNIAIVFKNQAGEEGRAGERGLAARVWPAAPCARSVGEASRAWLSGRGSALAVTLSGG